jgi:hypothetical protein
MCDKNMQPFLYFHGSSQKIVIFKWLGLPKAKAMLSFPLGAVFALGIYALWQCCGLGLCSHNVMGKWEFEKKAALSGHPGKSTPLL